MTDSGSRKLSVPLQLALKCLLSLGLLLVVVGLNRQAFRETLAQSPNYLLLSIALVGFLSGVTIAILRWWLLVKAQSLPFEMKSAFRLGWIGMFFNLILPGAVGGDVIKATYLAREHQHKSRAIASIIVDRLVALLALFTLAASFGFLGWEKLDNRARPIVIASAIASVLCFGGLVLAFSLYPEGPLSRRLANHPRWKHRMLELHAMGIAYRRSLPQVGVGVVMALMTHVLNVLAFYGVILAISTHASRPSLIDTFSLVPLVLFSTAIPLPFSGLGAAENVSSMLFQTVGYGGGAVAMVGFRLFQLAAALIGATVYLTSRSHAIAREGSSAELGSLIMPVISPAE